MFRIVAYRIEAVVAVRRTSRSTTMDYQIKSFVVAAAVVVARDSSESTVLHSLSFCNYSNDQGRLTKTHAAAAVAAAAVVVVAVDEDDADDGG